MLMHVLTFFISYFYTVRTMIDSWTLILLHKRAASVSRNNSSWFQHSVVHLHPHYGDLNADTHFHCTILIFLFDCFNICHLNMVIFWIERYANWYKSFTSCVVPQPPPRFGPPFLMHEDRSSSWDQLQQSILSKLYYLMLNGSQAQVKSHIHEVNSHYF